MCEFLFQLVAKNGFGAGDPVDCKENGAAWGRREDKRKWLAQPNPPDSGLTNAQWLSYLAQQWFGNYAILQVTDMSLAEGQALLAPEYRDPSVLIPDELIDGGQVEVHKRPWTLHLDEMPAGQRNALIDDGYIERSRNQIAAWFRNKTTNNTI